MIMLPQIIHEQVTADDILMDFRQSILQYHPMLRPEDIQLTKSSNAKLSKFSIELHIKIVGPSTASFDTIWFNLGYDFDETKKRSRYNPGLLNTIFRPMHCKIHGYMRFARDTAHGEGDSFIEAFEETLNRPDFQSVNILAKHLVSNQPLHKEPKEPGSGFFGGLFG